MNITLWIWLSVILVAIAAAVTMLVLKQESKKSQQYAGSEDASRDAFKRSKEYEENSVSSFIPVQIWSYGIVTIVSLVIILYIAMK